MQGSANSNIFETIFKSVTSPSDEKRRQTVVTPYSAIFHDFQNFLRNCVNVSGRPIYETSKYLIRVLMNIISSSACCCLVSKQHKA